MFSIVYEDNKPIGLNINEHQIRPYHPNHQITLNKDENIITIEDDEYNLDIFKGVSKKDILFDPPMKIFIDLYLDLNWKNKNLDEYSPKARIKRNDKLITISFIEIFELRDTSISNISYNRNIERYYNIIKNSIIQMPNVTFKVDFSEFAEFRMMYEYVLNLDDLSEDIFSDLKEKEREIKNFLASINGEMGFKQINVYCEGKTDYMHLKAALNNLKKSDKIKFLVINFCEKSEISGDDQLLKFCKNVSLAERDDIIICIFDDDNGNITRELNHPIRYFGNNVYSLVLPAPANRKKGALCIEMYYDDNVLGLKDENGRKLYLREDFDRNNGFHKTDGVICLQPQKKSIIVDSDVIDTSTRKNVALSKDDFAAMIYAEKYPFNNIDFKNFELLFNLIEEIKKDKHYMPNGISADA